MAGRGKVTVAQIAEAAGVSPATVSRVMNHRNQVVKEETLRQVMNAMKELGVDMPEETPLPQAQPVIILNLPSVNNIFYSQIIQGAVSSANSHGCHLIINQAPLDFGNTQSFFDLVQRVNAAGVITAGPVGTELLNRINAMVPVVQCCEYNEEADISYVTVKDRKAAQIATQYLIDRGFNKVAFINGPSNYKYSRERLLGYLDTMEHAGITVPPSWICQLPEVNYDMAYSIASQLLSSDMQPNAFFTVSDTYAAAVIRAAKRFHYHVAKDIAVVGFDNTEISSICTPAITTVSQPRFQIGYSACEILLEKINNPQAEPRRLFLETELIIRESA